jgi:hypothetical protein
MWQFINRHTQCFTLLKGFNTKDGRLIWKNGVTVQATLVCRPVSVPGGAYASPKYTGSGDAVL